MGASCYEVKPKKEKIKEEIKWQEPTLNKIENISNTNELTTKNLVKNERIISKVIWIDPKIDNIENISYINELKTKYSANIETYKNSKDAIFYMKKIKFEEIKIIINSSNYSQFVKLFKKNIINMYFAPKIIVFTNNISRFHEINPGYDNIDIFYKYGGITSIFEEVKKFLVDDPEKNIKGDNILKKYNPANEVQLTFEYIDCREKLLLPMFFKTLISSIKNENINMYTNSLYNTYSKDSKDIKILLDAIISMKNIPIEILSKYYARLYTIESNFYRNLNKELGLNQIKNYLSFIKVLYEGVKLKALPLASDIILYRGSKISNQEITKINNYLKNKKPYLPSSIVFSRSFLSFSKERGQAESFLHGSNNIPGLCKVLYILEKDDNFGYNLSTHGDLENISFFANEKEVLFFPFSSFEIKNLALKYSEGDTIYEIRLIYLGKYLEDIKNDDNITSKENLIPESEFKKQLFETGLFPKENIVNLNTKFLYNSFKKYERETSKNNSNNSNGKLNAFYPLPKLQAPLSNKMHIFVKTWEGKIITLDVEPSERINDIKLKIQEKENIPHYNQELTFNGKRLSNMYRLVYNYIQENSTLYLSFKKNITIPIFVKHHETINLYVNPSDDVYSVKLKIQDKKGFIPKQQELIFKGMRLEDHRTLDYYDIQAESTLALTLKIFGG